MKTAFLFIEGRLSRFSKIGGEMVPHETVEQKILAALGAWHEGEPHLAITSATDARKGGACYPEHDEIDQAELREKLHAAGVPNLWIPKSRAGGADPGPGDRQTRPSEVQRNCSEGSGVNLVVAEVAA